MSGDCIGCQVRHDAPGSHGEEVGRVDGLALWHGEPAQSWRGSMAPERLQNFEPHALQVLFLGHAGFTIESESTGKKERGVYSVCGIRQERAKAAGGEAYRVQMYTVHGVAVELKWTPNPCSQTDFDVTSTFN